MPVKQPQSLYTFFYFNSVPIDILGQIRIHHIKQTKLIVYALVCDVPKFVCVQVRMFPIKKGKTHLQ